MEELGDPGVGDVAAEANRMAIVLVLVVGGMRQTMLGLEGALVCRGLKADVDWVVNFTLTGAVGGNNRVVNVTCRTQDTRGHSMLAIATPWSLACIRRSVERDGRGHRTTAGAEMRTVQDGEKPM